MSARSSARRASRRISIRPASQRPGAEDVRKSIHMHINFGLFADILRELAATAGQIPKDDVLHREQLAQAAAALHKALAERTVGKSR